MSREKKEKIEHGFYRDISNEDYHGDKDYLSSSALKTLFEDKEEFYRKYILGEKDDSEKAYFIFGSFVHTLILEPHLASEEYAVFNGASRRGKAYTEFKEANPGKSIILVSEDEKGKEIHNVFSANKAACNLISEGVAEQSLFTEIEGVDIKVRPDWESAFIDGGRIIDVKTTNEKLTRKSLQLLIKRYNYDLSAALYVDAYSKKVGLPYDFYFMFIKKAAFKGETPQIKIVKASEEMIANGRRKYKYSIQKYKELKESGDWVEDDILELDPSPYDVFYAPGEHESEQ